MSSALSPGEVLQFHSRGYLGPFTLCSESDMKQHGKSIDAMLTPRDGEALPEMIQKLNPYMQRGFGLHKRQRLIFDLVSDRAVIDRVASLFGEDILLWRTMFFNKDPLEKPIPWHQDFDDWPIEPYLVISAWIAIDDVTEENGCMRFIPGSHRQYYPMVETGPDVLDGFPRMADPRSFDAINEVAILLKPGQFVLFNERLLHCSHANVSGRRRLGLAARYIPPLVRIMDENDDAILLRGEDKLNFNRHARPPP